ncbi:MAG: sensor histidine kinase KdpD [Polyangiaceae bacterium]|nr:sensor histidine kinase KdpD [Polyangiaceae bacterium]
MDEPPASRPDPDLLLRRLHAEEERLRRGNLKVFFGCAPGVGKTYAMLENARRLRANGVDVVIGCVETHGRAETAALCEGLEHMPMRVVLYRGAKLLELDLEGVLARKPRVLLLDELAHTNAPGTRHKKRWQDVLDLLDAGIEVHTTLNVQHIESLNDVVAQVTSVRVRETVPDRMLDRADEIELVDLPPEALLARLQEGKVYLPTEATRAAQSFFKRGNLLALRELALRRTADRVDADMQAYREAHAIDATWPAGERILVCVGPSPSSARLVRAARRMAAGLRAPWVAASVDAMGVAPMTRADRERLDANLSLAESLGGEVVRLAGKSVSEALFDYARRHNVTRLIVGKPTHAPLRDRLRGSLLDDLVRHSGEIDVHVISGDAGPRARAPERTAARRAVPWRALASATGLVAAATAFGHVGRDFWSPVDIVMIYLLVITVVAVGLGRGASLLAAALSVGCYDFFFVPPFYTFAVSDARHILTFVVMFVVSVVIGTLTLRVRRQEGAARTREERTAGLYALTRDLATAADDASVARVIARHAATAFNTATVVLEAAPRPGDPLHVLAERGSVPLESPEQAVARWVLEHGRPAGSGTDTLPGARLRCLPLGTGAEPLGVLGLAAPDAQAAPAPERDFVEAFLRQASLALERAHLADEAKAAALQARTEQLRSSLLSAVSHDLRTPLAVITGAATALRDDAAAIRSAERVELVDTICVEAHRLERLVGNILDMTRLESGTLQVKREWVPVDELVGAALTRLEAELQNRPVTTDLPDELPMLSVDPVLFEQLLVNVLDNAARYTPAASSIDLRARTENGAVVLEVADRGPGLPPGAENKIFEKFVRGPGNTERGAGLGLAICRAIAESHGGRIEAENREGGGATFRIRMPEIELGPNEASARAEASREAQP